VPPIVSAPAPVLSIVIPAWNEADWLPGTLEHLRSACEAAALDCEVVVVDNASTDETAALARAAGARVVSEMARGIARARNAGAAAARAPFLVFVDADTRPPAALLRRAFEALASGDVCGGGAVLEFDTLPNPAYRWGTYAWNRLSRHLGLAAGCFVFATREAFEAVGGFNPQLYAGEEVFLSRRLRRFGRRHGQRFEVLDGPPVVTSGRKAQWFSPWQHLLAMLTVLLFPLALRSRRLSWFWYRRPEPPGQRRRRL
jgi:glycosyltransferase involved in cell wall biosynthesis